MKYIIDSLAVIGALWIALSVFFAVSDTIKGSQAYSQKDDSRE